MGPNSQYFNVFNDSEKVEALSSFLDRMWHDNQIQYSILTSSWNEKKL